MNMDSLQFGFKTHTGTGQATWLVHKVLQHYLQQGSKPVAVVLDCTKAFDLAKFNILFERLLPRGLPAVVVRVLAFSYKEHTAWVRWGRSSPGEPAVVKPSPSIMEPDKARSQVQPSGVSISTLFSMN